MDNWSSINAIVRWTHESTGVKMLFFEDSEKSLNDTWRHVMSNYELEKLLL